MRWRAALLSLVLTAPATALSAQVDASLGVGGGGWRIAGSTARTVPVLGGRVTVGPLVRATWYGGDARAYTRRSGPTAFPGSLSLAPGIASVNLGVLVEVRIAGPVGAGVNLDLAGVAGGARRDVDSVSLAPATLSLFRYGTADRGSLNSEFYLTWRISPGLTVRGGLSHYATGYRTRDGGTEAAYQRFDDALFVAIRASH